jgi:hypothetical protein
LAGHDIASLVEEAIRMRPVEDAHSTAAVLHWRIGVLGSTPAPRPRGPLASLPPTDGAAMDVARQAGELMRLRWREIRAALATTTDSLPWAEPLGARPPDPAEEPAWLTAATAMTAYRERYEVADHTPMLGPRPAASRPDARAAWDHACLQADRYLARRLGDLDEQLLAELDERQKSVLDNPTPFDPSELDRARQASDGARRSAGGRIIATSDRHAGTAAAQISVQRLERAAQAHRDWRRAATEALALRRQIALAKGRNESRQRSRASLIEPPRSRRG